MTKCGLWWRLIFWKKICEKKDLKVLKRKLLGESIRTLSCVERKRNNGGLNGGEVCQGKNDLTFTFSTLQPPPWIKACQVTPKEQSDLLAYAWAGFASHSLRISLLMWWTEIVLLWVLRECCSKSAFALCLSTLYSYTRFEVVSRRWIWNFIKVWDSMDSPYLRKIESLGVSIKVGGLEWYSRITDLPESNEIHEDQPMRGKELHTRICPV